MCHFLPILLTMYGAAATACAGAKSNGRKVYRLHFDCVIVVSRHTVIMLTSLCSSYTGMQARHTLER